MDTEMIIKTSVIEIGNAKESISYHDAEIQNLQ